MHEPDRLRLRTTFDEVAELYDRARPGYPPELFNELERFVGPPAERRILEVGCGTGQATVPLAERGFEIVCVELGGRLSAVARRNLARFPRVEVVTDTFETWEGPPEGFDAVVAFTAFHWVDAALRYERAARLLRPAGVLAVVTTAHVLPEGGDEFFAEIQEAYDAVVPDPANRPPPRPEKVPDLAAEIAASGRFDRPSVSRFRWDVTYTADEYVDVLETYSGHRSMPAEPRGRLYAEIRRRIDARPGGRVRKTYLALLHVARRL